MIIMRNINVEVTSTQKNVRAQMRFEHTLWPLRNWRVFGEQGWNVGIWQYFACYKVEIFLSVSRRVKSNNLSNQICALKKHQIWCQPQHNF